MKGRPAKLSIEDRELVLQLLEARDSLEGKERRQLSFRKIAKKFNVSHDMIYRLYNRYLRGD